MEERIKASEELVIAMKTEEGWQDLLNNMVELQAKQVPGMIEFKDVFEDFFKKYMSWDSIKYEFMKMYTEEFTVNEIKQITEFFKSPVGEKYALKVPLLYKKAAGIGRKRVQDNALELKIMIENKMAEMEKTKKDDPSD